MISTHAPPYQAPRLSVLRLSLAETLAALSLALDMTSGYPSGHAVRSCLIGTRLAEEVGLDADARSALYYALLLKDAGCSSNAGRMATLFGSDDQTIKRSFRTVDWTRLLPSALNTLRMAGHGEPLVGRARRIVGLAKEAKQTTRALTKIRCERGAVIVRTLGFPELTAAGIRHLDEHWNGEGHPDGVAGSEIPIGGRIACISQSVEIFFSTYGLPRTTRMLKQRRGTWFDPELTDLVLAWRNDDAWWKLLRGEGVSAALAAAEPDDRVVKLDDQGLDRVAEAFAEVIDAKTPYTYRHSTGVARYARGIGAVMGVSAETRRRLYQAGLLHDIGKLGVSNRILEKPGKLDEAEWVAMKRHPALTWEILSRVAAFRDFGWFASLHHERLDGTGYPWGLHGPDITLPARILAVADIYEALTADRPYRAGMPREKALGILHADADTTVDGLAVEALETYVSAEAPPVSDS